MKKILVVEDDLGTNQVIEEFLADAGYQVIPALRGDDALELFFDKKIDLCILDIMLPGKNGIEILREIRGASDVPVIMLTALGDEYTQLKSFDMQADEYVTKPFSPLVLTRRVAALLKRANPIDHTIVTIGKTAIDFSAYKAERNGQPCDFTTREIDIIKLLVQNTGKVLSRQQILDRVWGLDTPMLDRTIDTHIKNIRKKLECDCISTVKGVGYRFEAGIC